jgi:hypothetical protein
MLLFLDFDGVLHPEPCYRRDDLFCQVPRFESIMRDFELVDIVISSSWRENRTMKELKSFFSPDISARIIGLTPQWTTLNFPDDAKFYPRHMEIDSWRKRAGRDRETWIALDDRDDWFEPLLPNLILCDASVGIDDNVETQLRRMLTQKSEEI